MDCGLKYRRVQLRHHLVGFDQRIEIGVELQNIAGDLAADLDVDPGVQLAAGGHRLDQIAPGCRRGLVLRRFGMIPREIPNSAADGCPDQYEEYDPLRPTLSTVIRHNVLPSPFPNSEQD